MEIGKVEEEELGRSDAIREGAIRGCFFVHVLCYLLLPNLILSSIFLLMGFDPGICI
jgi:hypothetical protein